MSARMLNRQEADEHNQSIGHEAAAGDESTITPFDFRQLNCVPKSQLTAIHALHETFVRTLASSLSLHLRCPVTGTLVGVEQFPFADVVDSLPSPTCTFYLSMQPYEGYALMEINHSLLAPILDHVLGGNGKITTHLDREITDVEEAMLEELFRLIALRLGEAWKPVVPVTFAVDTVERKPQLSKRIARPDPVVAVAIELRVGQTTGMINLIIPANTLKVMHQMLDQSVVHKTIPLRKLIRVV
jgi:flagellar motor switch protein FliM